MVDHDRPGSVARPAGWRPDATQASLDQLDDAALAERAGAGCREAAGVLIARHQGSVRSFLRRLTPDRDLADDLAQETFLRLLRHAGRYDPRWAMKTWLLTIARRLLINHLRRADNGNGKLPAQPLPGPARTPLEQASERDQRMHTRRALERALDELNETQRQVILLFHQSEMPIGAIAEVMQMPTGTVKSHLHRARAALRRSLIQMPEIMPS